MKTTKTKAQQYRSAEKIIDLTRHAAHGCSLPPLDALDEDAVGILDSELRTIAILAQVDLTERGSDGTDFRELHVQTLRDLMARAIMVGWQLGRRAEDK